MENETTTDIAVKEFTADTDKNFAPKANKLGADQDLVKLYNAGVFNKDTPTEPTISDMSGSGFQNPTTDNSYDNAVLDYYNQTQNVDENKIKRDVLKQFQGQIDATKRSYSQLLGEVKQQSTGRLGEDTAMQSRRGLLGSDFGSAQTEKTRNLNYTNEEKVRAAESAALAAIKSQALGLAQQEIAANKAAKLQGSQAWLESLRTKPKRKNEALANLANAFLTQNKNPLEMSQTELQKIADESNGFFTVQDIINSYLTTKRAQDQAEAQRQAELAKDMSFNLSEGQARYQYNPETGETELVASRAKTYAPKSGSSNEGGGVYNGKVLTASQKTAVDNLNSVETSLNSYKNLYSRLVGNSGINLTGADAGQLSGAYNALIFQIAQAAGTGALQAADREVVEAMIPNPTTLSGGFGSAVKGGKEGGKKAIDEAAMIFANKKNAILGETPAPQQEQTKTVQQQAEEAGYDYEAMRKDGLTDAQILESL